MSQQTTGWQRLPNLLIAGVGKAGTTSLFWYLSQHPDVCASDVKEPRYFRLPEDGSAPPRLESYLRHFRHCRDQRYVMEASPQYFKGSRQTIEAIRSTLDGPRILLMFRDPVERMWSEYRFRKARLTLPPETDFIAFVAACERVRSEGGPRTPENEAFYWLAGGSYLDHLAPWLDAFGQDIRVLFFEHMAADPAGFVANVCRWLGIDDAPPAGFSYSIENRSVAYRNAALQRIALAANAQRSVLRNRRRLKAPLRRLYYAINRSGRAEWMDDETRDRLRATFQGSNMALAAELRRRGYQRLPGWLAVGDRRGGDPSSIAIP